MSGTQLVAFRKFRIYRKKHLKFDIVAGAVVFLVALPLCLGIAMASGAPLFSGILSGILGGIIIGSLSASPISVSGPAAGLVAIVLAAITSLGDFNTFLLALMLAGILQLVIGSLRAGFIADYIPSSVIQGLLCAIGIVLIIKQLPLAFTSFSTIAEFKMNLLDQAEDLSLSTLHHSFHLNNGAVILTLISLWILIFKHKIHIKFIRSIPAPALVVLIGIILNEGFILTNSHLAQLTPQLVNIPKHSGFFDFFSKIQTPSFHQWQNPLVYFYAVLIAAITSIETLLNLKACEKLDKKRRRSSKDRELFAQGVGNIVAGLLGGLPMTSVVVRSSVNIQVGARSKMATIFHSCFILLTVILVPHWLNKIPLSSLAAILIYTGYQLTKPAIFKRFYLQGKERFLPFIVTVIGIIIFNLLIGILLGVLVSLFFILKSGSAARLDIIKEIYPTGVTHRLLLPQQITFLNKASLIAELDAIPPHSQLIIDARYANYIDKEIIEQIKEFKTEEAPQKDIALNLIGFKDRYDIHNFVDFITVTTYDTQAQLLPNQVLAILKEGNHRFLKETGIHRSLKIDLKHTAKTQHPIAVVLGCIDSRVPVETIFDMGFGDLFCTRIAGNVVNQDILASIEYACHVIGAKLIVVLGHTRCGAIAAACDHVKEGHITQLLAKIEPAIHVETKTKNNRTSGNQAFLRNVTELNIAHTLQHIYHESAILKNMINTNEVGLVGALYDVNTGEVHFKDYSKSVKLFSEGEHDPLVEKLRAVMKPVIS
jgi:carbonic anhydrase